MYKDPIVICEFELLSCHSQVTLRFAHGLEKAVSQQQGTKHSSCFTLGILLFYFLPRVKVKMEEKHFLFFITSDKCSVHAVNLLVDVVYLPYIPYLLDYPTLQQTFLVEQLQATRLVSISCHCFVVTASSLLEFLMTISNLKVMSSSSCSMILCYVVVHVFIIFTLIVAFYILLLDRGLQS